MTCYRVNWVVTEGKLALMHKWLNENRAQADVIRTVAYRGQDRGDGRCWYTKFTFKTEQGIRLFYRNWAGDRYDEEVPIQPWR